MVDRRWREGFEIRARDERGGERVSNGLKGKGGRIEWSERVTERVVKNIVE